MPFGSESSCIIFDFLYFFLEALILRLYDLDLVQQLVKELENDFSIELGFVVFVFHEK